MKKGAKKEPPGDWGVRGSFLRVQISQDCTNSPFHYNSFCMYVINKNRWQHQKQSTLCMKF